MTYLKKIIFAATLAAASLGFSLSSNAALITHDVLFGGSVVGEITVHLSDNGATGVQLVTKFESFSLFGEHVSPALGLPDFDFEADVDRDNIFAGIQFLLFDVDVIGPGAVAEFGDDLAVNGIYQASSMDPFFDPAIDNFSTIFALSTLDFIDVRELSLSAARVVPEPSVLALFALALVGFGVRRKAK